MVECNLPKVEAAGSSPVSRSKLFYTLRKSVLVFNIFLKPEHMAGFRILLFSRNNYIFYI
jgi:hypothetical protein